ncbi:putative PurR-regulated permease PerM [Agromyces flavus]|uniref:PurR-regulated permease PerM n=1 Tax=Agromyces flavus TaxID=589382 RepID=A0A1H1VS02_9MICO|nr:AI-2E family transporter [Agromyces flavus]MCP2365990.1 putative PurR-regulated permease PerM [Agromyces flavus]GGI43779.1 AI-2E family transporter [Agromyces flavus]SDS87241.1 Predicted PurR-regulated permease PerM [Agromyces flavus]
MFFRRRDTHETVASADPGGIADDPASRGAGGPIWNDRLGRWSIRSLQLTLLVIIAAIGIWALLQVKVLVIPVLVAVILAAAASPLIVWLRRHGFPAMLAAWVTLVGGIIVLGGIITAIVFAVRSQWDELADSATQGFDDLLGWVEQLPIPIEQQQIDDARNSIIDFITSAEFGQTALTGVSRATEFITGLLLMLVVLFFFLKDGDRIWAFFLRPYRGERLERGRRIGVTSVKVLGGYIRGTAIVAFVDAFFIGLGLVILQVPLALPLAVIVFLTSFIPIVGATLAGILAALVALVANGPVVALIVVAIVIVVNQLEGDLLQPVVMAQSLKLHPLVILIALTAGTLLAGVAGAVLAVPLTALGWAIIKVWNGPDPSLDERKSYRLRRRQHADATSDAPALPADTAGGTPVA